MLTDGLKKVTILTQTWKIPISNYTCQNGKLLKNAPKIFTSAYFHVGVAVWSLLLSHWVMENSESKNIFGKYLFEF